MKEKQIYVDDWNCVYRKLPSSIVEHSIKIVERGIFYQDRVLYQELTQKVQQELSSIGDYEMIHYLSGSQANHNAIVICKKYFNITTMIKMKGIYHGVDIMQVEENMVHFSDLPLKYIYVDEEDNLDLSSLSSCKNGLIIVEPMYLFAKYGAKVKEIINTIYQEAKKQNHIILFDEVRSGVWSMGTFLYSQQFEGIVPDIICFAKGFGLGVATSCVCFLKDKFGEKNLLKQEDTIKSNLSLSELALQRANDLLEHCMKEKNAILANISAFEEKMKVSFQTCINTKFIEDVHINGLVCILVFSKAVKKSKYRMFRQYLLASGIIVRHIEENLLYLNFAIDSSLDEISTVKQKICEALEIVC